MNDKKTTPLKEKNAKNLWGFVSLNALGFALVLVGKNPDLTWLESIWKTIASKTGVIAATIPLITLVLNNLIPSSWKAVIVFWRCKHPLPGCRAFSDLAKKDPRIDLSAIKCSHQGAFPRSPEKQNALWYQIYLKHADNPAVADSHRVFLLTRDLAVLSLLMLLGLGTAGAIFSQNKNTALIYVATLAGFNVVTTVAARNCGNRFVLNVLARESAKMN